MFLGKDNGMFLGCDYTGISPRTEVRITPLAFF